MSKINTTKSNKNLKRKRTVRSSHNLEFLIGLFGIFALCWTATFFSVFELSTSSFDHGKFPLASSSSSLLHANSNNSTSTKRKTPEKQDAHEVGPSKTRDEDYLVKILYQNSWQNIKEEDLARVPKWSSVKELYGENPKIYGLDRCEEYRTMVPEIDRHVGASGLFNTGTNVFYDLIADNCAIPARKKARPNDMQQWGMEWEVNWGKHVMPEFRNNHTVDQRHSIANIDKQKYFPIVLVRDPYSWMKSMCRHSYTLNWPHIRRCPNLFDERKGQSVKARYRTGTGVIEYDSVVHVWNQFLNGYYKKAKYPFLMVRFEDLVFYAEDTIKQICDCVGGVMIHNKFHYAIESSKIGPGHGKEENRTGLLDAWDKYSKPHDFSAIDPIDLEYAQQNLDKDLTKEFGYTLGPNAELLNARAALED